MCEETCECLLYPLIYHFLLSSPSSLSSVGQHLSNDGCLEDKREDYQNCPRRSSSRPKTVGVMFPQVFDPDIFFATVE